MEDPLELFLGYGVDARGLRDRGNDIAELVRIGGAGISVLEVLSVPLIGQQRAFVEWGILG